MTSGDGQPVLAVPAAARFSVSLDRVQAPADGIQIATATFTVSDANDAPVPGVTVTVAVSGANNIIVQPLTTDSQGHTTATLASTMAEVKHLAATVVGTSLTAYADVTFASGEGSRLRFMVIPPSTQIGLALAPAVVVAVLDANGNLATQASATVSVALHDNPSAATLSGTLSATAVAGVAVFDDLAVNTVADGYTLEASAQGLDSGISENFSITPSTPLHLVFKDLGLGLTAGALFGLEVDVEDADGHVVGGAPQITLTASAGTSIAGTTQVTAHAGVASFSGLHIDSVGTVTITASASGYASAAVQVSLTVDIAARLGLVTSLLSTDTDSLAGLVQVAIEDQFGNVVTSATGAVTVAASGPGISGSLTVNAVAGIASFSDLQFATTGSFALTFSSPNITAITSGTFSVTAGLAQEVRFLNTLADGVAGLPLAPVQVAIADAHHNIVTTAQDVVTLARAGNGGLGGTLSVQAEGGVATFADLSIAASGTAALTASSGALSIATSSSFSVSAAAAGALAFLTSTTSEVTAGLLAPLQVAVNDIHGNLVGTSSAAVTLALATNPTGTQISGTLTVNAVNGVATFANVHVNAAAAGYVFAATASQMASAQTAAFTVLPAAASHLAFLSQPSTVAILVSMAPSVKVAIEDDFGNVVSSNAAIGLSFGTHPVGALLGGVVSTNAVNGVATFTRLTVSLPGVGLQLSAATSGLTSTLSATFSAHL